MLRSLAMLKKDYNRVSTTIYAVKLIKKGLF